MTVITRRTCAGARTGGDPITYAQISDAEVAFDMNPWDAMYASWGFLLGKNFVIKKVAKNKGRCIVRPET